MLTTMDIAHIIAFLPVEAVLFQVLDGVLSLKSVF